MSDIKMGIEDRTRLRKLKEDARTRRASKDKEQGYADGISFVCSRVKDTDDADFLNRLVEIGEVGEGVELLKEQEAYEDIWQGATEDYLTAWVSGATEAWIMV